MTLHTIARAMVVASDEIYVGQREDSEDWTKDDEPREAFKRFGERLVKIERPGRDSSLQSHSQQP
ncbi:hypothetical protein CRG98_001471 [Punica granatum]|uniref:Lipoxygenase domain-containing protein n=1 Tax=Punica granatum TaxID=22663 RepID=A0A2I0LBT0_PUNGR|nr:hypothetical protein CRG98_001471 [Punica granatum]